MGQPIDTAEVLIVPDLSDFGRILKAELDSALRGIQAQVAQSFGRIESAATESGIEVGEAFQRGGERAEASFRETSTAARREFAEVEASATSAAAGITAKLGGALALVKTSLLGAGVAAAAGLGALTAWGLKSSASLEQTQIGMESLLGSTEEATKFIRELQTFSATTPFEFGDVTDASRRILAFGQSVGITRDEVIPTLTTIGNLVSVLGGTAENTNSVVRALSQMASKGKLSQEEIMQLAEALPGFNANAAIAAQMGLSVSDTMAKITAGEVDATTGINALLAGMGAFPGAAGAMVKQSQTLTGMFSTFKDTVGLALTDAFAPVIPGIKQTLGELTPVLGGAIQQLAPALGRGLQAILPLLGKLVEAIVPILIPIIDALGPALEALGPALVPLGEAIGEVLIALGPSLPLLAQFVVAIATLAVPVLLLLAQILKLITPLLEFMTKAIAEFNRALQSIDWAAVGEAIASWAKDAWNSVKTFFENVGKAWDIFVDLIDMKTDEFVNFIKTGIDEAVGFITGLPDRAFNALKDIGTRLVESGKALINGFIAGVGAMGGQLWSYITGFVDRYVIQATKRALGIASPSKLMADEVGAQIPAGIAEGIRAGVPALEDLAAPILSPAALVGNQGVAMGGVTIIMNFHGGQPSEADARALGAAAGDGLMDRISRQRAISLAGRTA